VQSPSSQYFQRTEIGQKEALGEKAPALHGGMAGNTVLNPGNYVATREKREG